ncbi:hypothetical protein ABEX47_17355 [Paenibacillus ehimensis]|uniref:hypothetical protein n=1 Tax=Paenibacillus ehimensis TaxID=79264 RepID=UPI003D2E8336
MEDISQKEIDRFCCSVTILAYKGINQVLVDDNELKWHLHDGEFDGYLTLAEISDQLTSLGYESPYRVWWEMGLRGEIFQYGNYKPEVWEVHGKTRGYA